MSIVREPSARCAGLTGGLLDPSVLGKRPDLDRNADVTVAPQWSVTAFNGAADSSGGL